MQKKEIYQKLLELEESNDIKFDISHRGGSYAIAACDALDLLGIDDPECEIAANLPRRLGAGCNYLGGGVRGAVFGSVDSPDEFISHGVAPETAQALFDLVEVLKDRYIDLEGDLNSEFDEDGEPNWDAMATKSNRRAGVRSAY